MAFASSAWFYGELTDPLNELTMALANLASIPCQVLGK